jgi:1-acyl-sn-glycerol-3-phosphate acyltransferase
MSDATYRWARLICTPPFWMSASPVILHADRAAIAGGYILAPNHLSPFDVPMLIRHTPRFIDFLGRSEFKRSRRIAWFFSLFNTFYVDRSQADPVAALSAVRRLQAGRVVGIFPEGAIRPPADSVVNGGPIKPGIARLACLADVPVIPCVVLNAAQYSQPRSWLPLRRTRYGVIFGNPLRCDSSGNELDSQEAFLQQLKKSYLELGSQLATETGIKSI